MLSRGGRKHPCAICESCPLQGWAYKYVPSEFPDVEAHEVQAIVVGEAPGVEEVINKRPFWGPSGQLLRSALEDSDYDTNKVVYTNAVLCRPPDNVLEKYEKAVDACRPRLEAELGQVGDDVPILATGNYGATTVLRLTEGQAAPKKTTITRQRGQIRAPLPTGTVKKQVHLTVHPAYVLRVPSQIDVFKDDIRTMRYGRKEHWLQAPPRWVEAKNPLQLVDLLEQVPNDAWVAFDVETENLRWYKSAGWGGPHATLALGLFWSKDAPAIIIGERMLNFDGVREVLNGFFGRLQRPCAHNGKFDLHFLRRDGLTSAWVYADTLLMHYALQENPPHGLKELASHEYHVPDYEGELVQSAFKGVKKAERNYRMISKEQLYQYLAWDVAITWQLAVDYSERLRAEGLWEKPFLFPLMSSYGALWKTEHDGVTANRDYLTNAQELVGNDIGKSAAALARLTGRAGFKPNSWQQVGDVLWKQLGYKPVPSKHYSAGSTSVAALQAAKLIYVDTANKFDSDVPFVKGLLHYRRLRKIQGTYLGPILASLDEIGRTHPTYFPWASQTGRLSAKEPPIQTIPRASADWFGAVLRSAFESGAAEEIWRLLGARVASPYRKGEPGPEGAILLDDVWLDLAAVERYCPEMLALPVLVMADYSQAELRVWTHLTQDPYLLRIYREGRDLHDENAARLFGPGWTKEQRTWMKNWVFAFIYGGNEYSFASQARLPLEQAAAMARDFEKLVPIAVAWRETVWQQVLRDGYLQTVFGRRRRFPAGTITKENWSGAQHEAWNFEIQSTASDLNLVSHARMAAAGWRVVISMHDMLAIEVQLGRAVEASRALNNTMVSVGEEFVPTVPWKVDVDVVTTWVKRPRDDDRPDIGDILGLTDEVDYDEVVTA